jgi:hypothetical protein
VIQSLEAFFSSFIPHPAALIPYFHPSSFTFAAVCEKDLSPNAGVDCQSFS